MLLNEQIIKIIKDSVETGDILENLDDIITSIIKLCVSKIEENSTPISTINSMIKEIRRTCLIWDLAAKKLENDGIRVLKIGGLKEFYKKHFPEISEYI